MVLVNKNIIPGLLFLILLPSVLSNPLATSKIASATLFLQVILFCFIAMSVFFYAVGLIQEQKFKDYQILIRSKFSSKNIDLKSLYSLLSKMANSHSKFMLTKEQYLKLKHELERGIQALHS